MKKLIGIGIAAMMVMGLGVAANAYTIKAEASAHVGNTLLLTTANGTTLAGYTNLNGDGAFLLAPSQGGKGTAGTLYQSMGITPAPAYWTLKAFVDSSASDPTVTYAIWGSQIDSAILGKTWGVQVGSAFTGKAADCIATGVWASTMNAKTAPVFTFTLPSTANMVGEAGAITLTLGEVTTVSDVPEPGSILALASGLAGLVGFGIRRRK